MKKQNLSAETTENLLKKRKISVTVSSVLTGMLLTLLALTAYICFTNGFTPLVIMPFTLSPIVYLNYIQIKSIDQELQNRNHN
jgi:uncharacterized membrane protein